MADSRPTVIITTVNPPSRGVGLFAFNKKVKLLVIGDKQTPDAWSQVDYDFLSTEMQDRLGYHISKQLPYNHYARKNIGYIYAIKNNATMIVDTDDDNIPKDHWGFPLFRGKHCCLSQNAGFVNVYRHFTTQKIWPRGYPLELVNSPDPLKKSEARNIQVGVWQGLADGDPDVDAIYRLVSNEPCIFEEKEPIVLLPGTVCPFNSQNTAFSKAIFPLLYLPSYVSFRYTDILRGLIAQPIMWQQGFHLGFISATVVQERNPHDYLKDFESEIPCYLQGQKVVDVVIGSIRATSTIADNLYNAYDSLCHNGLVDRREIELLSLWLLDLE